MDQKDEQRHCFSEYKFDFAFDNPTFSDRTLKLLIFDDSPSEQGGNDDADQNCELADQAKYLKRIIKQDIPKQEEGKSSVTSFREKKVHISTVILAERSSFFRKLFSIGMKECEQSEVVLRMYSYEEVVLMEVLKFMYSCSLSANSPFELVKVLMIADKFDVPSCVSYCCKLLLAHTMTLDMAFLHIDLLSSIVSNNEIAQLVRRADEFIATNLNDIPKYHGHIMNLSLDGMKVFLSNDHRKVDSENTAYDLFFQWVNMQFPDVDQQSKVFYSELCKLVRLEHLSPDKWKHALTMSSKSSFSLDPAVIATILEAIVSNKSTTLSKCRCAYNSYPLAVTVFDYPVLQCTGFWNLTRNQCENLGSLDSESFVLGSHVLYLSVNRSSGTSPYLLCLRLKESKKQSVEMEILFAIRDEAKRKQFEKVGGKISWRFAKDDKGRYSHKCDYIEPSRNRCYNCGKANCPDCSHGSCHNCNRGYNNGSSTRSEAGEPYYSISSCFIDDIMHLRFDVTLISE